MRKSSGKASGYDWFIRGIVYLATAITVSVLLFIIWHVVSNGVPHLKPSLFEWKYTTENVSMMPAIINTLIIIAVALTIAMIFGIGAAIYLVEYAKPGNKLVAIVRITTETLSGIPSIVYGLFGMLFFVTTLNWGYSVLSGAMTVAIMILPTIMRSTEEALMAVPMSLREASYGLGAAKLRTVFRIVLPSAMQGILAGVILGIGRIIGETAALLYTAGSTHRIPSSLFNSARTLAIHMYLLAGEGLHKNEAYATAVVLLIVVILINLLSNFLAGKLRKEYNQ